MEQKATRSHPYQLSAQSVLENIREVSARFDVVSLNREIEACENLFTQDRIIDVAILGQFKAGKSSFINSLIDWNVLPVGVIPVTTVITRLYYDREQKATVTDFDGTRTEVTLDNVEQYISEEKNPANKKNVEVVDIGLPALSRYQGLRLVDTPGLGSAFKYNTETSREWLPEVGAAIVAVSADRPLSENDLDLLRDLARYTPKTILLLTKTDLLSEEQQEEVVKFFRNTLKREINRELPIYLYSIRSNTEFWKSQAETFLLSLSTNRDVEFTNIVRHKMVSLAKSCMAYLAIAFETSEKADADRDSLKNLILTEQLNYDLIRSELFLITRENMLRTRSTIAARLESKRGEFTKGLMDRLQKEMPTWQGNLWQMTRKYEAWLEENLSRDLALLSQREHRHFFGTLNSAYMSVSRSLDLFRNLLEKNIEAVLGVKLSPTEWNITVAEPPHPDVAFMKVFDFHFDLLWFLIPMVIFRGVFEKKFLRKIPGIAQMHLSRLAYQWEVRINRTIEGIRGEALTYVQGELSTIDGLLSRTAGRTDEIRAALRGLERGLASLEDNGTTVGQQI
ncbi:MAG: dynamin family protein [Syntrophorhabdales bacterium]|jgi:GTP-binding protein EngB required for normal cell division